MTTICLDMTSGKLLADSRTTVCDKYWDEDCL